MKIRFYSRDRIRAEGAALYSFLEALRFEKISCVRQRTENGSWAALTKRKDRNRIQELAKQYHVEAEFQPVFDLWDFLRLYRRRWGIFTGIFICFSILFYFSNTVSQITIDGNVSVSETEIYAALTDYGVSEGSWIPSIDFGALEMAVKSAISNLSWVAISHQGSVLSVSVREETSKPKMLFSHIPCNYVAVCDGWIQELRVYRGTAVKQEQEAVRAGDLIISGVCEDAYGKTFYRHADGIAIGVYEQQQCFFQPFVEELQSASAVRQTERWLYFFGMQIPLSGSASVSSPYDYEENTVFFSLCGTNLPVGIRTGAYQPYTAVLTAYTETEVNALLEEAVQRYEQNFLSEQEIRSKTVTENREETGVLWTVRYVLCGEIGQKYEIYVK